MLLYVNIHFFYKPLTYWEAHAYAVKHDPSSKKIECCGGIKWGYRLSYWQLRPICLSPESLTSADWEKDYDFFKSAYFNSEELL